MTEYLIAAGTVIIGPANKVLPDGAVLVRDQMIVGVGSLAEMQRVASPSAQTAEFPASTLLPGLINAHVRLVLNGGQRPAADLQHGAADQLPELMAERAALLLAAGVTTVRDVGDIGGLAIQLGKDIAAGHIPGPRVLAAGAPLTVPDGDGSFLGGVVASDEAIRAAVRERAAAGAALICYHGSGGYLSPDGPPFWDAPFTDAHSRLIVEEAARYDLPVAVNVYSAAGLAQAVAAGAASVEHCLWSTGHLQYRRDEQVARQMATQGTFACIPSGRNRDSVVARHGEARAIELFYSRYQWFADLGVQLVPGTTAGSTNSPFDDYVSNLETYEWMGFSLAQIVDLATCGAASALGLGRTTGSIQDGYSADLLVVDGDPLKDLQALRRPQLVMAAGRSASFD